MAGQCLLSKIAEVVGGTLQGADRSISRLSIDSRQPLDPRGTLFIALQGKHHDGHRYLPAMRQRGLYSFLVRRGAATLEEGDSAVWVDDPLKALQDMAAWHRAQFRLPVVGITGSNGKTVVKEWLYQLLAPEERIVRSPGSWNSQVGVPLSVWEIDGKDTLGLFEAGISEPGEMDALERIIAPDIGIFTNIGPAHGAHFASDAAKADEKAKLFRRAKTVVFCSDHATVREALNKLPGVQLLGWGRKHDADLHIVEEHANGDRNTLQLLWGNEPFTVELPFSDDASVENALHCITLMLHLGRSTEQVAERVRQLRPVSMRLETLPALNNGTLLNDAYSNDLASLTIALGQLARTAAGRTKLVVLSDIADSGEAPEQRHAHIAGLLRSAGVEHVIAIGPAMREHAALFPAGTRFFDDADALLNALPEPPVQGAVTLVKGARSFGLERVVARWEERTHGTVMEVDLEAMRHNLNHWRERCGPQVRIMGMVKAGGYGSGAVEMARFLAHEQVAWLGVAYADEGIELRRQGIRTPVLVMNPEPVPMETLHRYQLQAEVYDHRSLRAAMDFAAHVPDAPAVHIKLDTGMHRLGFLPQDMPSLLEALRDAKHLRVASIFSHLAASEDPQQDAFTRGQIALFKELSAQLINALGYTPLLHIANSAAATRFPEARLDMVRLGIGLHGIGADAQETAQLRPVETLRTVIAQVKELDAGESVSYGRKALLAAPARIAVLPIGYADGLSRRLGEGRGRVWVHGQQAKTVGTICMDMCMVDVTRIPCAPGDEAIVFSPQHPLQDYARDLGTIPYEALTSISPRVKRVFVRE
ncbi:MAG TPA: bifunctional UDP-N-acetylmuramoyl-tripeptide:D-alanyl-D-alanine ligase/alanine racemase [Flavobacteriales bacterium]|nr:bifunctional UDP-N-acetylmuramoyl-tripeptide:D-alanyl-D-alanine ligase/alanine racemase [Flavobacteriales bacterium]